MAASQKVAKILAEYNRVIRAYFERRCRSPEDAEDLVQEASCAIISGYARFSHRSSLSTWIYAICRNVYYNHQYRSNRQQKAIFALSNTYEAQQKAFEQTALEIRIELDKLSQPDKALYSLFYVQGKTISQIARVIGKPEGTVKYLLYRLRKKIKDILSP